MNLDLILAALSITVLVLTIACFLLASECDHWKREYETLRNAVLAAQSSPKFVTREEYLDAKR